MQPSTKKFGLALSGDKQVQNSQIIELLVAAHRELRAHRENLEAIVAERVRELTDINRKLAELACMDGLTGIANRRHFDEMLNTEWRRMMREGRSLSLVICDVDHFKRYNDFYGHPDGDRCLRDIATLMRATFTRPGDLVARYGGEEFAIILPDTSIEQARTMALKLRRSLERQRTAHADSPVANWVTVSAGIASRHPDSASEQSADCLLKEADQALYQAKDQGRNAVVSSATHAASQECNAHNHIRS